jgi:7,8-dihydropterin-6-yl-methyl-4-(beta-D-ribofuranosyl)aminobenzene 5'-phosphate synthase
MMEVKITTLSENTAGAGYLGEWGLCMFIDVDGKKILFDTGAGFSAVYNAHLMGVNLTEAECIVISHGHYDHTGGLRDVLTRMRKKIDVYAHPDVWGRKYGRMEGGPERYVGIPFPREALETLGANFRLSPEPVKLAGNITTTGYVPMTNDYEVVEKYLLVKENGELKQDSIDDDQAMVIDADYGLVVILGCSHHGIVNTLQRAREITGKDLIYAAIGGTHLVHASQERLEKTAAALLEMGVQYLGVSHCTGFKASAYLAQVFGDRFFQNNAGTQLTLPFKER